MHSPTFRTLVEACGRVRSQNAEKGDNRLVNVVAYPVLMLCANEREAPGTAEPPVFKTKLADSKVSWNARVAMVAIAYNSSLGTELSPEWLGMATTVHELRKRPGGPFPDRVGVGRARTTDVCIPLQEVSKYHAYFSPSPDGETYSLTDARSLNGTTIAGRVMEPGETAEVRDGAPVAFGRHTFLFFTPTGFNKLLNTFASKIMLPLSSAG